MAGPAPVPEGRSLEELRAAAQTCQACPLWEIATQTVFGSGPAEAKVMLLGEAPGEQEDREGVPFVGASGRLLDEGLTSAGLDRAQLYITNTVKHRPSIPMGSRRKNRPPKQSEINACRPWLLGELASVRPRFVVCLGAVAAKAMLGRQFRLTESRGRWVSLGSGMEVLATVHPSFVLIQPADRRAEWRATFFADLALVAHRLAVARAA